MKHREQGTLEHILTRDAMEQYGDSFVASLAVAWRHADNHAKLLSVFSSYLDAYYATYVEISETEADKV